VRGSKKGVPARVSKPGDGEGEGITGGINLKYKVRTQGTDDARTHTGHISFKNGMQPKIIGTFGRVEEAIIFCG